MVMHMGKELYAFKERSFYAYADIGLRYTSTHGTYILT